MYRMKGLMICGLVLERTDKYGKSVVAKMESLPDGLYFIEKKRERFGICAVSSVQSDVIVVSKPKVIKKESKPNKAIASVKKTIVAKLKKQPKKAGK